MAKRPVFSKELGEYFTSLREAKGWKQATTADIAARRKIHAVTYNKLRALESGKVKTPSQELLRGLASLYEISYEELADAVLRVRYGIAAVPNNVTAGDEKRPRRKNADGQDAEPTAMGMGTADALRRTGSPVERHAPSPTTDLGNYALRKGD